MHRIGVEKRSVIALAIFPSLAIGVVNELYLEPLYRRDVVWFWAADFIQFVFVPALVVFFLIRVGSITPRDYGFRQLRQGTRTAEEVGLCLFMCLIYWLAYEPMKQVSYLFLWPHAGTFNYGAVLPQSFLPRLGVVVYLSTTAAFVEETVFRGLPWLYFSQHPLKRYRVALYVVSTSLLFSAIHSEQGPHGMLAAFSLGVVAAMLYAKLQNQWPFVVAHFVTDVISFW